MSGPLGIEIDSRTLAGVADAFERAPEAARRELTMATWEASLLLEREAKENTPVGIGGGGGLKGSISAREPQVLAEGVIGMVSTPLSYAVPVEFGAKPHMPPVEPIKDWVEHKLAPAPEEVEGIAWAIAMTIKKEGTKGAHMFERAIHTTGPQVQRIFVDAMERLGDDIARGAE